jgi:ESCRT-II complex subunit VPS25
MEAAAPSAQFVDFPPFYTLQPVAATRAQQLKLWRRVVLEWFAANPAHKVLALDSFPPFANDKIERKLDAVGRKAVAQDLIESGHGAWQADNTTLYVYVKTPADWAAVIYEFVSSNGLQGAIYTLYELHSGDLTRATSIQGMEPTALLRALELLERAGKAQVFPNDESIDETGVKFV